MEESGNGGNLKRAALYGVAGLMTAAIGASTVNVLAAEDKKPDQRPAAQSAPATPSKPGEPTPPPPPAPKPLPVLQTEAAPPAPELPAPVAAQPAAPPVAQPVAQPVAKPVVKPVAKPVVPVVKRQVVAAVEDAEPPAPAIAHASVQASGAGKAEVALHVPAAKPVKKPSPTDEALKKAKSEATEAKKKVKQSEKALAEAKKDYDKKKGEIKKIQKQKNEEKKTKKPKPVEPVLTVKTSPDMEKRLKVHTSKQKSGKKVTISVSSSAHSG
ncbi:hypothetical protein C8D87_105588 [Lentzea atacamensis]|uniref:Uncharacterized protein n=1 Tax=Lentzea atacamensis TaxID=531938 RepID=A0ABX9E6V0_9PSEU|nr:hypothetical protein [Lentzea atacamensis]RAS65093.1 hypothetical protein C8D87_105588 [Lentzea atacamensis]